MTKYGTDLALVSRSGSEVRQPSGTPSEEFLVKLTTTNYLNNFESIPLYEIHMSFKRLEEVSCFLVFQYSKKYFTGVISCVLDESVSAH